MEIILRIQKAAWYFQGYLKANYISLPIITILFYIQAWALSLTSKSKLPCVFRTNLPGLPTQRYFLHSLYPNLFHEGLGSVNIITIILTTWLKLYIIFDPSSSPLLPQPLINEYLWFLSLRCILYSFIPLLYSYCHCPYPGIHQISTKSSAQCPNYSH